MLIGRWGCSESPIETREDSIENTNGLDRTLADTRKRLSELHTLSTTNSTSPDTRPKNKQLVGTAASPDHSGEERPDRWRVTPALAEAGRRWGIDPGRDLRQAAAGSLS